jgi:hypothetical protein
MTLESYFTPIIISAYTNGDYRIVSPTKVFNTFRIAQELNLEQNTTGKTKAWYKTSLTATTLK